MIAASVEAKISPGTVGLSGGKSCVDIVVELIVMLLAEMQRQVAADPNEQQGGSPIQKSVPVHRYGVGVKRRFRRVELYLDCYDAARSRSAAAVALLSSSRLVPNCLSIGSTARVRNRRALMPPPPMRRFS